jgi:hypothetical protein
VLSLMAKSPVDRTQSIRRSIVPISAMNSTAAFSGVATVATV